MSTPRRSQVQIQKLGLERGNRWLFRDLNFEIPCGSFVVLSGPSGVGKSSLLQTLAGLLTPSEGLITYSCDQGCHHNPQNYQSKIGFIFQKLNLIPNNSVLKNLLCGRLGEYPWWKTLFGFPKRDIQKAESILEKLGILSLSAKWVCETSGGEQQRTAIARTLIQEPELILADEPVAHLDLPLARSILSLLKSETTQRNATTLCALHQPELIQEFADWILELSPHDPRGWKITENRRP